MSKLNKSKGIEAYKVVVGEKRESLVYYFIENNYPYLKKELKTLYSLMKKLGYIKNYPKGAMRVAKEGSAGIMCFKSSWDAKSFQSTCNIRYSNELSIIKVKGFEIIPEQALTKVGIKSWKKFLKYNELSEYDYFWPPDGTIAFKRIRILE